MAVCPECGRRTFKPYITPDGTELNPAVCGRCNREVKCGYHMPPRDYIKMAGSAVPKVPSWPRRRVPASVTRPGRIDPAVVAATMGHYDLNPLARWLAGVFGPAAAAQALAEMGVGTSRMWGGAAVFWYTDQWSNTRTGKIMGYDPQTGRRLRDPARVAWVHRNRRVCPEGFETRLCFFGTHQLGLPAHSRDTVLMVESEKTALMLKAALARENLAGFVPVATGGCGGLSLDPERLRADCWYKWREFRWGRIVLLPDADMAQKWRDADLSPLHARVTVVDPAADLRLCGNADAGDWLASGATATELIKIINSKNP